MDILHFKPEITITGKRKRTREGSIQQDRQHEERQKDRWKERKKWQKKRGESRERSNATQSNASQHSTAQHRKKIKSDEGKEKGRKAHDS